ncbi:MAG: Crp/Fnr family transcriptional regulator [Spirochaetaceae bacterium]|nr:Crp/Fnr family transcriptional regulator [Spirochaetaceae bacterium]
MDTNFAASSKDYKNGDIIFAEFEIGSKFYLIQHGKVELVKQIGAIQKTLDVLHETEVFGEMALLEDTPRTATAIAITDVKLLEFDKNNFQSLVLENPQLAIKLLRMFSKRIYDAKRRFLILTLDDNNARIADVILMLNETNLDETASNDYTGRITLKITPDYLARWAGISQKDAAESINFFSKQGALDFLPDRIIIKNINYYNRIVNAARNRSKKK